MISQRNPTSAIFGHLYSSAPRISRVLTKFAKWLNIYGETPWSRAAASFSYGEKDYYLGCSPLWQLLRVVYRATKQPLDDAALLAGYCWAVTRRAKRPVSREFMRFHRREQMKKLRNILSTLLKFRKINNFYAEIGRQEAP